jgi:subtilisin family serine protease
MSVRVLVCAVFLALLVWQPPALADPQAVIVELAEPGAVERIGESSLKVASWAERFPKQTGNMLAAIDQQQRLVLDRLGAFGPVQPVHRYRWLLNGFSGAFTAEQLLWLRSNPRIASVRPVRYFEPLSDASAEWVGADQVWQGVADLPGSRGEGSIVGVADTGINPNHVAFRERSEDGYVFPSVAGFRGLCASGGSPCNNKLIGMYEFAGLEPGYESNNGRDITGHGTHVAGIAAGNPTQANLSGNGFAISTPVSGIAPRARIISYRVCAINSEVDEERERCPSSSILAAMDQAVADGVDVLNLSLGGSSDPWTVYLDSLDAHLAGISLVAAAGNDGPRPGSINSPAAAPWILSVANTTHDRRVSNDFEALSGGDSPLPALSGVGLTSGVVDRAIVSGADFGNARCSQGEDLDFPPNGSSNPFAANTFNGQIVVCERGAQARVAKSFNVAQAGAGGMVLVNQASDGDSIVADEHFVPATHLGYEDGRQLLAWLNEGDDHRGSLTGARFIRDSATANQLTASSSRGPISRTPDVIGPEVAAPGTNILAPDTPPDGGVDANYYGFKTGTSMATPQVAGAIALLKSLHPQWSPDDLRSAIVTTASSTVIDSATGELASVTDVGAGVLNVPAAAQAGLSLRETGSAFVAAGEGGAIAPGELNLPGLVAQECRVRCQWTRTFYALRAGNWSLSLELDNGATGSVVPDRLAMQAVGQLEAVEVEVDVSNAILGENVQGRLVLTEEGSGYAQRLPIVLQAKAGALPAEIRVDSAGVRGRLSQEVVPGVALDALYSKAYPLAPVTETLFGPLQADASPWDPYDDASGTTSELLWLDVSDAALVHAEYSFTSVTGGRINMYLGRDTNDTGSPRAADELCRVEAANATEFSCSVEFPEDGRYWLLLKGQPSPSGDAASSRGELEWAVVPNASAAQTTGYRVTGPGQSASGVLDLTLSWEDARLANAGDWLGAVALARFQPGAADLGLIRVRLGGSSRRPGRHAPLAAGDVVDLQLGPLAKRTGDYFIAPPWSGGGSVRVESDSDVRVRLHLRQGESFDVAAGSLAAQADFTVAPGNTVNLPGNVAQWFLAVENLETLPGQIRWQWRLSESTSEALTPGLWFNPNRNGHGMEFNRSGDNYFLLWYSYDEKGEPTWYLANAQAQRPDYWTAPLQRFVWNGDSAFGTVVGSVEITTSADGLRISSALLGEGMSEPLQRLLPAAGCAAEDPSGAWFDPAESGWGVTLLAGTEQTSQVLYLYDNAGEPRWVLGQGNTGSIFDARVFRGGFCPWCDWQQPSASVAGSLSFSATSPVDGEVLADVNAQLPSYVLSWQRVSQMRQLSDSGLLCN